MLKQGIHVEGLAFDRCMGGLSSVIGRKGAYTGTDPSVKIFV